MLEIENVLIIHTVPILAFPTLLFHSLILTSEVEFVESDKTSQISSPGLLHRTGFQDNQNRLRSQNFSHCHLLSLLKGTVYSVPPNFSSC